VTIVGSISSRLTEKGRGASRLSAAQLGLAGTIYVIGACTGRALLRLPDGPARAQEALHRHARALTSAPRWLTAFSISPLWFFVCRFFTGAGIGGEYAGHQLRHRRADPGARVAPAPSTS